MLFFFKWERRWGLGLLPLTTNTRFYFFQISEGLTFLHNDVKLVHYNICPQSIVLNKSGAWKIAGLEFCIRNANTTDQAVSFTVQSVVLLIKIQCYVP